jgi:hypothetical protein
MRGYAASGRWTYTKFHLDFEMLALNGEDLRQLDDRAMVISEFLQRCLAIDA